MTRIEVGWHKLAPAYGRQMKQFDERHQVGVVALEANLGERLVIAPPVAAIRRQQERMMHGVAPPERHAVLMVFQHSRESRALDDRLIVVGIEADE
ncbi:hypothetical protein RY831_03905 [Noviherbaspirillum sp. CPCC 100848]|uniref:Uncharacterized protein n=1 Tax=Noviherbaspirillum album TaxID=3080276 RepID=A0ABU6J3T6_9BURK|nr:hypothetical protein [Noviherbaspirillum sp. CPCC 100848]MEC4718279.1 hypothetical protein [Noviherbaspirillum sp. CPCC 100848]